jgi:hypothetical protein
MTRPVVQTNVSQSDESIDDILFGAQGPTGGNVLTASDTNKEPKKPGFFTRPEAIDTSFLDEPAEEMIPAEDQPEQGAKPGAAEPDKTKQKQAQAKPGEPASQDGPAEDIDAILEGVEPGAASDEGQGKPGRPKTDKSGLVETFSKLIEAGKILPFDDEKPLDQYSAKDFEELLEVNFQERDRTKQEEIQTQFFESLPEELQYAYKYVADGGTDMKSLFKALSQVEEVRELDPENADHQSDIVKNYLRATNFGTDEEIAEEIKTWEDLGLMDKKAKQFKPKLDKMQQQVVAQKVEQQKAIRRQQEEAARTYVNNVYEALKPGELNGIKLDKKQQGFLYNSLINAEYPSISGQPTNLLGHLLEKYQYVEPNYSLIAEALWLLSDPETYRTSIGQRDVNKEVTKQVRTLKTEQSRKVAGQQQEIEEESGRKKLSRQTNTGFFRRN